MRQRNFHRMDRVNAELRRELGGLVHAAQREHGLPWFSVDDVEASRELDVATVWITTLNAEDAPAVLAALKELGGHLRWQLSQRMRIRRVPELRFKYDDSAERGERIDHLLKQEKDAGRL